MPDPDKRIERLRVEVELKRAALFEHRAELFKLQTELESFAGEYARRVGWLEDELEAVNRQIEEAQRPRAAESVWGPGIASFEEYLESRRAPPNEPIRPLRAPLDENSVRALYRKLARKYHPDTTTDPEEKAQLSAIMARINTAYQEQDLETLQAVDGQTIEEILAAIGGNQAVNLETLSYAELLDQSYRLDEEIIWTKIEHQKLLQGPVMMLKIEVSLARSRGRDLLQEMAADLQRALEAARHTLEALRGRPHESG